MFAALCCCCCCPNKAAAAFAFWPPAPSTYAFVSEHQQSVSAEPTRCTPSQVESHCTVHMIHRSKGMPLFSGNNSITPTLLTNESKDMILPMTCQVGAVRTTCKVEQQQQQHQRMSAHAVEHSGDMPPEARPAYSDYVTTAGPSPTGDDTTPSSSPLHTCNENMKVNVNQRVYTRLTNEALRHVECFFTTTNLGNRIACTHMRCSDNPHFTVLFSHANGLLSINCSLLL